MPLGKVAGAQLQWWRNVALYTLAGALTSVLVGVGLGSLGRAIPATPLLWYATLGVILIAVLADSRVLQWAPPQLKRQTNGDWSKRFGTPIAATLWGLDLGLTVSTRLTYWGVWALLQLVLVLGDWRLGGTMMGAYWVGRAATVWIGPKISSTATSVVAVLDAVWARRGLYRAAHVLGLVLFLLYGFGIGGMSPAGT